MFTINNYCNNCSVISEVCACRRSHGNFTYNGNERNNIIKCYRFDRDLDSEYDIDPHCTSTKLSIFMDDDDKNYVNVIDEMFERYNCDYLYIRRSIDLKPIVKKSPPKYWHPENNAECYCYLNCHCYYQKPTTYSNCGTLNRLKPKNTKTSLIDDSEADDNFNDSKDHTNFEQRAYWKRSDKRRLAIKKVKNAMFKDRVKAARNHTKY